MMKLFRNRFATTVLTAGLACIFIAGCKFGSDKGETGTGDVAPPPDTAAQRLEKQLCDGHAARQLVYSDAMAEFTARLDQSMHTMTMDLDSYIAEMKSAYQIERAGAPSKYERCDAVVEEISCDMVWQTIATSLKNNIEEENKLFKGLSEEQLNELGVRTPPTAEQVQGIAENLGISECASASVDSLTETGFADNKSYYAARIGSGLQLFYTRVFLSE